MGPEGVKGGAEGCRLAIALGSNLGDRLAHLKAGMLGIESTIRLLGVSSVYETDPVGGPPQPTYLNAVAIGVTVREASDVLQALLEVEAGEGRTRSAPNEARTLDLDLVLFGDRMSDAPGLELPHPRWKERSFVLAPLAEVAPDWVDPVTGRTVLDIWLRRRHSLPAVRWAAPPEALWRTLP